MISKNNHKGNDWSANYNIKAIFQIVAYFLRLHTRTIMITASTTATRTAAIITPSLVDCDIVDQ